MKLITISEDFSEFPGLRNCSISEKSGEEFYHTILNSAFKEAFENEEKLIVNLDYTDGYASSFLDEAFGNLVYDFTLGIVTNVIEIVSIQEPHWVEMIRNQTFLQWEARRLRKERPKVTIVHSPWYRFNSNRVEFGVWESPTAVSNA